MRGALGAGAAVGVAGVAAGCARTRPPRSAPARAAGNRRRCSRLVVAKPTGPVGLPLPRTDNSVTWAITDDNPPIKDGLKPEGGTLQRLQLRRLHLAGPRQALREGVRLQGQDRDLQLRRRGDREALGGRASTSTSSSGLSANDMVTLIAQQLMLPLNHSYLPNLEKNIWPRAAGPVLRPRRALHRALRRLAGRHRLAQRQDRQGHRRHEGAVGHLLGVEAVDAARSASSTTSATRSHADAARRDARGRDPRPQHRGRRRSSRRPAATSRSSPTSATSRSTITDYQTLPEGKSWLHHSWSGDLLARGALLPAEGHQARRALVLGPGRGRRGAERLALDPRGRRRSPCSRTRSSTSCSTRRTRTTTSCSSTATRRRRTTIDGAIARQAEADPEDARDRHPAARPVREQPGAARAQRRGQPSAGRTPGRSSRRARWSPAGSGACSRCPASRGSRSSSWSRCTRCSAWRSATRTRSTSPCRSGTRSTGTSATCSRRCATSGTAGRSCTVFLRTVALRRDRDGALAR